MQVTAPGLVYLTAASLHLLPPGPLSPLPAPPTCFSELGFSRFYTHTSSHSTCLCLSQFTFTCFTTCCSVDSPPRPRAADAPVLTSQHGTRPRGLGQNPVGPLWDPPSPHSKLLLVLLGCVRSTSATRAAEACNWLFPQSPSLGLTQISSLWFKKKKKKEHPNSVFSLLTPA